MLKETAEYFHKSLACRIKLKKQKKATYWHFPHIKAATRMKKCLMFHTKTDFWPRNSAGFSPKNVKEQWE